MYGIILACYKYYLPAEELDKYITLKYQDNESQDNAEDIFEIRINEVPKDVQIDNLPEDITWVVDQAHSSTKHQSEIEPQIVLEQEVDDLHHETFTFDDILNADIGNLLDYCLNQTDIFEEHEIPLESLQEYVSLEASSEGLRTPKASSTRNVSMTPQSVSKTVVDVLNTPEASYSSPIKRKIGDLEEEVIDDKDDMKKRMTGGWLKTIVQDANVNVFGVLQICVRQEKAIGENILTLLKVSDGECVSWQATAPPAGLERVLSSP